MGLEETKRRPRLPWPFVYKDSGGKKEQQEKGRERRRSTNRLDPREFSRRQAKFEAFPPSDGRKKKKGGSLTNLVFETRYTDEERGDEGRRR